MHGFGIERAYQKINPFAQGRNYRNDLFFCVFIGDNVELVFWILFPEGSP